MKEIFSIPDTDPPHHIRSLKNELRQHLQRIILAFLTFGLLLIATTQQLFVVRVVGLMSLIVAGALASLLGYYALIS
ncbi:MAG: hypothetical protein QOD32_3494 [Pyrinomonadaceae bacterium]|nr:hypothetical protein [Pyrinomonadaceae bacterium]